MQKFVDSENTALTQNGFPEAAENLALASFK
jgi:hypothetical protein